MAGLDQFTVAEGPGTAQSAASDNLPCTTNRECSARLTAPGGNAPGKAICRADRHRCVRLTSEDCSDVTGDYLSDDAIVIASLFSTTGAQATTNRHRQQSATLAVSEINAAGGIPSGPTSAHGRPLVMVSCDEAGNLDRAATHLVRELGVAAIVGPNTSQDTLDLSTHFTIEAGTVVMSPTAVASSIADLADNDVTWLMVPSDVQRAPLMLNQIGALEDQLKRERLRDRVRLGVIYRNDALGLGTRASLNGLIINGAPLGDAQNLGRNVKMDGYAANSTDQNALVDAYLKFAPDVLVIAGTAEAISEILLPLDQRWNPATGPRPYYLLTDSSKVPELITAVTGNDDLRRRIRGTGVTPSPASASVYNAFRVDYSAAFNSTVTYSGMGPAYDATFAIAYALAATDDLPVSGASIAQGLRKLTGGRKVVEVGMTSILSAFQTLTAGDRITAIGTFSPLEWNEGGAVSSATLEMWCVATEDAMPVFHGSGLTYDIGTSAFSGTYQGCTP